MDPRKLSVKELVSYCLNSQDQAGWTEFVRRFQPPIAGVVTKCAFRCKRPQRDLIDELVQETFLKLLTNNLKALRSFDFRHENAFYGFLKVVASRVVEDHFRGSTSEKRGGGREDENIDEVRITASANPRSSKPAEQSILFREIEECLAELAGEPNFDRDRTIFWLYYRDGLTAKAIAGLPGIGLSVKGVESTLLRLTRYVRGRLNAPPPPPRPSKKRAAGG